MKGKALLGCLSISLCLLTGYQTQVKTRVLAESKESVSSQQESMASTEADVTGSSVVSESVASEEATVSSTTPETTNSERAATEETSTSVSSPTESSTEEMQEAVSPPLPEVTVPLQPPVSTAKVEENYQFSVVRNQTTQEFIQAIGVDAQRIAWQEGLYASVMIAQAILETGSGNSQLARPPYHNLFGIKGNYQGKSVTFNTQEDKGNGQLYTIRSAFRQYPSYKESLEDYAVLLKTGLSGNPHFYQATWRLHAATYHEAAKALTGKYATDTSYDKKLIALIETYELEQFDVEPNKASEEMELPETKESIAPEAAAEVRDSTTSEVSLESPETNIHVSRTKQKVVMVPPAAQRPAKQLAGNRTVH